MTSVESRGNKFGRYGLLLLIAATLCLDFFHGIALRQHQVLFHPIYRLRQSLGVAVSRLHYPPPGGYLAYRSVMNVFNENGFAIFPEEPGPHLDAAGWAALFDDGPKLNRIIEQARDVPVDTSLTPDIIGGNELGFADYIYYSFRLFGDKISSLYYFYFLILAVSVLLYARQFRRSPFFLFLLVIYLAEIYFLQNYALSKGLQLNTITNSRLFSALSLLPACHILFVLWRRRSAGVLTVTGIVIQCAILTFLLSCRTTVAWQPVMILMLAALMAFLLLRTKRPLEWRSVLSALVPLWPAAILFVCLSANFAVISFEASKNYAMEPEGHLIWHEVLMGILSSNMVLRREYVGDDPNTYSDNEVYTAVIRDLNTRHDSSSPISRIANGNITIDLMRGWGEYDKLVRSLTLRIMLHHPLGVIAGLPVKLRDQIDWYTTRGSFAVQNLLVPVVTVVFGCLAYLTATGFATGTPLSRAGVLIAGLILVFALIPPMIEPSSLSVDTLFCYLAAFAILLPYALVILVRLARKLRPAKQVASLDVRN